MQLSVIIPVWNGEAVISDCLDALFRHSDQGLLEVICVDNASEDRSASIIASTYPQVHLLPQPVNLGFAGGVNAGIKAAQGDIVVLLNQDCLVHDGWLTALRDAFSQNPNWGIAGGTIFNTDGSVNHAGAAILKPTAYGSHYTAVPEDGRPQIVEYVTGAIFAIRRNMWAQIGPLDEGFYPAYFEESDYCFRARHHGFEVVYIPGVAGTHLFSSREWQKDPIKHHANQHRSRYRFIIKHFTADDLLAFFQAETDAIVADVYFEQVIGRLLAARDTLRNLPGILADRQHDFQEAVSDTQTRLLSVGFTQLSHDAWGKAHRLGTGFEDINAVLTANKEKLQTFQNQEYDLLAKIYFKHPTNQQPESRWQRLWRLLVLRPLSFITLRDYLLLAQLNTLHVARIDQLAQTQHILEKQMNQRLVVLEALTHYEFR